MLRIFFIFIYFAFSVSAFAQNDWLAQLKRMQFQRDSLLNNPPPHKAGLSNMLFDIYVSEVTDTAHFFSLGDYFGYCGDVKGGILTLLQTWILHTTSHVRFTNEPAEVRFVFFRGTGYLMNTAQLTDTSQCVSMGTYQHKGRDIVLDIMSKHFGFTVEQTYDSLPVLGFRIVDTVLCYSNRVAKYCNGDAPIKDSVRQVDVYRCQRFGYLGNCVEKMNNIMVYDETRSPEDYYDFEIPLHLYKEKDIEKWNEYLKTHLGIAFIREKRIEPIYTITFLNGK
ncbi:MAG: hypothetical protein RL757_2720 [Bacteroidota bacterium]|jgi:hypothetical protein